MDFLKINKAFLGKRNEHDNIKLSIKISDDITANKVGEFTENILGTLIIPTGNIISIQSNWRYVGYNSIIFYNHGDKIREIVCEDAVEELYKQLGTIVVDHY